MSVYFCAVTPEMVIVQMSPNYTGVLYGKNIHFWKKTACIHPPCLASESFKPEYWIRKQKVHQSQYKKCPCIHYKLLKSHVFCRQVRTDLGILISYTDLGEGHEGKISFTQYEKSLPYDFLGKIIISSRRRNQIKKKNKVIIIRIVHLNLGERPQ